MPDTINLVPTDASILEGRKHPPVDLSVSNVPTAIGSQATVTVAAGGTGVRHVFTNAVFSFCNTAVVAVSTVGVAIIDGSSGGATTLWRAVAAVGTAGYNIISSTHLSITGSANTPLTCEFSAGVAGVTQCVSMSYHDIGI